MFLGAYVEKTLGRSMHVWDGECHVHAGIRPADITAVRAAHPGADFLIHPECGCSTSVMEYVAAGDVEAEGVHMLSTGGMLGYAAGHAGGGTAIVATETGMLHPLRRAAPDIEFIAANEAAHCQYMKMITLPKLRDALRPTRSRTRSRCPPRSRPWRGCRSSGWSLSDRRRGGRDRSRAVSRTERWSGARAGELFGRVAVDVGLPTHLQRVPQRSGLVDPLEPGDPVERRGDEDHDDSGPRSRCGGAPCPSATRAPPSSASATGHRSPIRSM